MEARKQRTEVREQKSDDRRPMTKLAMRNLSILNFRIRNVGYKIVKKGTSLITKTKVESVSDLLLAFNFELSALSL